jgi:hypothetical protein
MGGSLRVGKPDKEGNQTGQFQYFFKFIDGKFIDGPRRKQTITSIRLLGILSMN